MMIMFLIVPTIPYLKLHKEVVAIRLVGAP